MKTKIKRKTESSEESTEKEKKKTEEMEAKELEDLIEDDDQEDIFSDFTDCKTVVEVKENEKSIEELQKFSQSLQKSLDDKNVILEKLDKELHDMNSTIQKYQDGGSGDETEETMDKVENGDKYLHDKDSLVFHGVESDLVEEQMQMEDADIKKSFIDQRIRDLLMEKCEDLPKTNGVEPILVVFEDKAEKDQLWTKLSMKIVDDIVKKRSNIAITNDSSQRRKSVIEANSRQMEEKLKKTAIVKPMAAKSKMKNQVKPEAEKPLETTVKFKSPTRNYNKKNKVKPKINTGTKSPSKQAPRKKSVDETENNRGRIMSIFKDWKSRTSHSHGHSHGEPEEPKVDPALEEDVYDGLDASVTLLIHGLESDWIEEEMTDDDDFKKDVLEVKLTKHLESIGYQNNFSFQFLDRWSDGPQHNNVPPVVVTFKSKEDRNDLYSACKDGLKKTTLVVTMDSKSRLAGKSRKEISTKLNFGSFLEHYKSYNVAQDLYNKMVRLL